MDSEIINLVLFNYESGYKLTVSNYDNNNSKCIIDSRDNNNCVNFMTNVPT